MAELFGWAQSAAQRCVAGMTPEGLSSMAKKLQCVNLTTEFTGLGSAELALHMVLQGLVSAGKAVQYLWLQYSSGSASAQITAQLTTGHIDFVILFSCLL